MVVTGGRSSVADDPPPPRRRAVHLVVAVLLFAAAGGSPLVVSVGDDGRFNVTVAGERWVAGGGVGLNAFGEWRDVGNGGLALLSSAPVAGSDSVGAWTGRRLLWAISGGGGGAQWETAFRDYTSGGVDCVVFEQHFRDALNGTAGASTNDVATVFPSFTPASELGFLAFYGNMACQGGEIECTSIGVWSAGQPAPLKTGLFGGAPLVLFNRDVQHAVVVSPFSNFMASQQVISNASGYVECGLMGGVDEVPAGFTYETVVSYGPGVNAAMRAWGATLLKRSGKTTAARDSDHTINYLGYYTDNGGMYYYKTEPNRTYAETLEDVLTDAAALGIPFRYVQLDSWWYYKGSPADLFGGGVKNWTAMESIFPAGLEDLHEHLRMPLVAHNRFWSGNTDYAVANGGEYEFLVEGGLAIPLEQRFWDDLFANSTVWGLAVYEQVRAVRARGSVARDKITHAGLVVQRVLVAERDPNESNVGAAVAAPDGSGCRSRRDNHSVLHAMAAALHAIFRNTSGDANPRF